MTAECSLSRRARNKRAGRDRGRRCRTRDDGVEASADSGAVIVEDYVLAIDPAGELGAGDFDLGVLVAGDAGVGDGDSPEHGGGEVRAAWGRD